MAEKELYRHLEEFLARLGPVIQGPDARAALEAGIVQWNDVPPPEGVSERGGFSDIRTGAGLTTTFFHLSEARPPTYPADLPWVPASQATVAEFAFADDVLRSVSWTDAPRLREAAERLVSELLDAGWEQYDPGPERPPDPPGMEMLAWLRRADRVRMISYAVTPTFANLQMMEAPALEPWRAAE